MKKRTAKAAGITQLVPLLKGILKDKAELEALAWGINPDAVEWDGKCALFTGSKADFQMQAREVKSMVARLLTIVENVPPLPAKGRGRPVGAFDQLDHKLLECARKYVRKTSKRAANGATGNEITNQGGPFVRYAAQALGMTDKQVIARIQKLHKHPESRGAWEISRRPPKEIFGPEYISEE